MGCLLSVCKKGSSEVQQQQQQRKSKFNFDLSKHIKVEPMELRSHDGDQEDGDEDNRASSGSGILNENVSDLDFDFDIERQRCDEQSATDGETASGPVDDIDSSVERLPDINVVRSSVRVSNSSDSDDEEDPSLLVLPRDSLDEGISSPESTPETNPEPVIFVEASPEGIAKSRTQLDDINEEFSEDDDESGSEGLDNTAYLENEKGSAFKSGQHEFCPFDSEDLSDCEHEHVCKSDKARRVEPKKRMLLIRCDPIHSDGHTSRESSIVPSDGRSFSSSPAPDDVEGGGGFNAPVRILLCSQIEPSLRSSFHSIIIPVQENA